MNETFGHSKLQVLEPSRFIKIHIIHYFKAGKAVSTTIYNSRNFHCFLRT